MSRHVGPLSEQPEQQLVIRCDGGPWHGVIWTPTNPAGVLYVLRVHGWSGAYYRYWIDRKGRIVYRWRPDFVVPP